MFDRIPGSRSEAVGDATEWLGGPARARVIVLLAGMLALGGADLGAIGSMADILQDHFSISTSQIGYLVAASRGAGIVSTLLFGWLVDRSNRTRLLAGAVMLWGAVMLVCGVAPSYEFLLIIRIGLGFVAAAAYPAAASLIGDFFPPSERGKIYGFILSGEMIGTGVGFVVAGEVAAIWWRLGFWILAIPAVPLALWMRRLPEPLRGGPGRLALGQQDFRPRNAPPGDEDASGDPLMTRQIRESNVVPRERLIRDEDPGRQSIDWAIKYVLSVPSNLVLIIGSALAYAFFANVRTFGVEFFSSRFNVGHSLAIWLMVLLGVAALAGIWIGGRLGDRILAQGHLAGRVWVVVGFFWATIGFSLLALLSHNPWLSMIFLACGAVCLGGVNPPLDSARLDVMHPMLWGRAESVRSILRNASEAVGPVVFGWLTVVVGGGAAGLRDAFLIMLIPLGIAAAIGFVGFRTYPGDVAAADAYRRRTMGQPDSGS
ncbi:MAG: MFS transporter [bacterium]